MGPGRVHKWANWMVQSIVMDWKGANSIMEEDHLEST